MPKITFNVSESDLILLLNEVDLESLVDIIKEVDNHAGDVDFSVKLLRELMEVNVGLTVTKVQKKKLKKAFEEFYESLHVED